MAVTEAEHELEVFQNTCYIGRVSVVRILKKIDYDVVAQGWGLLKLRSLISP